MEDFDVTLVFCTFGRTQEVKEFFSALRKNTSDALNLQILVVDQNEAGRLLPFLPVCPSNWNLEYIRTQTKGICAARNLVLPRIKGKIVAFPDDDCIYCDGTLNKVVEHFEKEPTLSILLGVWSNIGNPRFNTKYFEKKIGKYSLFHKGEAFVQFYRKEMVEKIGLFDDTFGPGENSLYKYGGDDSDYLARGVLYGAKTFRCSDIHVLHPEQKLTSFSAEKICGYGICRMVLLKKLAYPFWFKAANVLYPLARLVISAPSSYRYYYFMFCGRLKGIFTTFAR